MAAAPAPSQSNPLQCPAPAPVPGNYAAYYQYGVGPQQQQQQQQQQYNTQFCAGQPPYYTQPVAQPQQPDGNGQAALARAPTAPAAAPATESYFDYTEPQTVQELRASKGSNEWATGMWSAPCAEPGMCLCAFVCPCCCTFLQRRRLLMNNWNNYRCCAGTCRFSRCCPCLKNQGCGVCSPVCLALETMFCLGCAVFANRYMVKRHYKLKDECCDTVIIWSSCVCHLVARIVRDNNVSKLADCWYAVVLSCMLAQGEHQMNTFHYPSSTTMK